MCVSQPAPVGAGPVKVGRSERIFGGMGPPLRDRDRFPGSAQSARRCGRERRRESRSTDASPPTAAPDAGRCGWAPGGHQGSSGCRKSLKLWWRRRKSNHWKGLMLTSCRHPVFQHGALILTDFDPDSRPPLPIASQRMLPLSGTRWAPCIFLKQHSAAVADPDPTPAEETMRCRFPGPSVHARNGPC
jgi:hypothetical protein